MTLGNVIAICEMSKDLLADGQTPYKKRVGEPFKRPIIPFGAMIEYYPVSAREQSRLHQFGKKVLPGIFLGYEPHRGGNLERRHYECGYRGIGKDGRIRNLSVENQRERSIDITKGRIIHIPSWQMAQQICQGDYEFREPIQKGENRPWGVKISVKKFKANRESLNRENQLMTVKPVPTSGRSKVTSSIVITMNLEFNSTCRRKKHSPFH